MALMQRDQIITKAREIMGMASNKGGLSDSPSLQMDLNNTLTRMCGLSEAMQTVFYLSTKAGSKYLPLPDEILWVTGVRFIPAAGGVAYYLDLLDGPVAPGSNGDPRRYWRTAVNVPDVNGPSTPSLGLDPIPTLDGSGNVILDCIQIAKDLVNGTDVPELMSVLHPYIAYGLVEDWAPTHEGKKWLIPIAHQRFMEGVGIMKKLLAADHKVPHTRKETMPYRRMMRARF